MKKAILSVIGILAIFITFSFTNFNVENERVFKITSEHPIVFDMVQNGKTTKGLQTPYEFKFTGNAGDFIFKSNKAHEKLKVSVEDQKSRLTANWEIIVLTIESDTMKTFGMN
ncbi:hypothetical protein ACFFVB_00710 [Formosa undariae]|uniref:Uncharacterized protein n=1 Tax=Formosa undariae TaxID=1325436 RepID=A0ABV5EWN1_9FLAO